MERTSIFKRTHDDWYGNYPNNTVILTYSGDINYRGIAERTGPPLYRVSVWEMMIME